MSRGSRFPAILALLLTAALLLSACGGAGTGGGSGAEGGPEKSKIVLAVGGAECLCYLPTLLAYELGYFEEEGLTVDFQDLQGGSKSLQALQGGSADVVSGYYEHTIRMQVKEGKPITSFVNFSRVPGLVLAVSKHAADRINSVADLKGAKVGVTAAGSSTHNFINYLLAQEGLQPSDISVVAVGLGATAVAALEQGSVDAAVLLDPAVTQLMSRDSIKILIDTRTLADTHRIFGSDFAAGGLYTTREFMEKNPETVQRLTNAIMKALRYIHTHSAEEIAEAVPEAMYAGDKQLYIEAVRAALPGYSTDGLLSEDAARNTLEVLALSDEEVAAKKAEVKLEETFTDEFVRKVPAAEYADSPPES